MARGFETRERSGDGDRGDRASLRSGGLEVGLGGGILEAWRWILEVWGWVLEIYGWVLEEML